MKKLFSFMLILFLGVGLFGLPAIPLHPGGDAPGLIIAQADIPEVTPAVLVPMAAVFLVVYQDSALLGNEASYRKSAEQIDLWFEQYQAGLVSAGEFMKLVNGRMEVVYMRELRLKGLLVGIALDSLYLLC
ncbi:MAG: hypothetical protein LBB80_04205 [Treponema sp.]|nr:hypothetical protein [Treponema sp.]